MFLEDFCDLLVSVCKFGFEGVIGKCLGSVYCLCCSNDWIKLKCQLCQEFVIVGYIELKGFCWYIGVLLFGFYSFDEECWLCYVGKVGSGFIVVSLKKVCECLEFFVVCFSLLVKVLLVCEIGLVQWVCL